MYLKPCTFMLQLYTHAVADPGFPVMGKGGTDIRLGHFSAKMYTKMKELGPVGGGAAGPGSATGLQGQM